MRHKILIIDDEEKLRELIARIISLEGFEVLQVKDCSSGLNRLAAEQISLVLCDVKLPDGNGVSLCQTIKKQYPDTEIILLTAYGNIPDGVQAIKNGAFDYITKGDDNNKIIPLIYRAIEKIDLARKVALLEKRLEQKYSFDSILGETAINRQCVELAKRVAATDTSVLLIGETGTGKEVFAQAIHQGSNRSRQHFVAINCSAFSRELLESEMFGHRAGAFTGAVKEQKGLFEEANNGSIFLDELGELAYDLQAKLLRVLETGEFIKVGDHKPTKVNVRIIAATNRDLAKDVAEGKFRQDLYYRISVFQIMLPALRDRVADIDLIAAHFLSVFAAKVNKSISHIDQQALDILRRHRWPGNIRELKNVIERSVILCDQHVITSAHLPLELQHSSASGTSDGEKSDHLDLASAEKLHIQRVLKDAGGNKTETARLLNIALTTLYRKIEEYKITL